MPDASSTVPEDNKPDADRQHVEDDVTDLVRGDNEAEENLAGTLRFDDDRDDAVIERGTDVLTADGEKVGEVLDISGDNLVVEQGFYIARDIYLPRELIASHDDVGVHLSMTRGQFESRDWSNDEASG